MIAMATHVPFSPYHPMTDQSHHLSPSPGNLSPLPVEHSTAATLCGQLVLIGGEQDGSRVNSIHQLVEGQWVEIGYMTSVRAMCLAVSLSPDRILIVGGYREDSVEECVAV